MARGYHKVPPKVRRRGATGTFSTLRPSELHVAKPITVEMALSALVVREELFRVAKDRVADAHVNVLGARVYESLHPLEMFAEYVPD